MTNILSNTCGAKLKYFRRLDSGGEFLFQAHDDAEMNSWISNINSQADADSSGPSRSQTLPASAQKEDSKRRSFFTLKKT